MISQNSTNYHPFDARCPTPEARGGTGLVLQLYWDQKRRCLTSGELHADEGVDLQVDNILRLTVLARFLLMMVMMVSGTENLLNADLVAV